MYQNSRKTSYKFDIIVFATILALSVAEWVHMNILFYRAGLRNSPSLGFILFLLYEPLKIGVVLFALVRVTLPVKPRRERRKCIITASLTLLIFFASWILPMAILPAPTVFFLKGYEKWVHQNVDCDTIQTWLLSEDADVHSEHRYYSGDFPDELPNFIKDFGPKYVVFDEYKSEKGKFITFEWGGALGHWGIVVGPPTITTKQEGRIRRSKSIVEYRHPIKPGIYLYYAG